MGVTESVDMDSPLSPDPWSLGLEELDPLRGVKIVRASSREPWIVYRSEDAAKPRLVIQADPDEEGSGLELGELARLHLNRMGVLEGRGEALDLYPVSPHGLYQRLEVR